MASLLVLCETLSSELEASGKLQLTRYCRTVDARAAGNGTGGLEVSAWVTEVDVVERVEGVHAELEDQALPDGKVFLQGQVRVGEVRTEDTVTA
jgi:hypothetical protein